MSPASIDVLILAKNEEADLPECLKSVQALGPNLGEIIVLDDFSEDRTESLALLAGAKVVKKKLAGFAERRDFVLSLSQAPWVFYIDCDERLTQKLAASIQKLVDSGRKAAGSFKRRTYAFGRRHRFGPLAADRVIRLFPREAVSWEGLVHERPVFTVPLARLKGSLEHRTYASWDEYLEKWRDYAVLWARDARLKGRKSTVGQAAIRGALAFLKMFFAKLGVLGGPATWALCWYYAGYVLSKYLLLADASPKNEEEPKPPKTPLA
jgi:glycosyltransferase involved in cell wall biosynthesis